MARFPTAEVKRFLAASEAELREQFDAPDDWPHGYCSDACCALFPELKKLLKGFGPRIIDGFVYMPKPNQHYAWGDHGHSYIQCLGGTIIDPTARQFLAIETSYAVLSPKHRLNGRYSEVWLGR